MTTLDAYEQALEAIQRIDPARLSEGRLLLDLLLDHGVAEAQARQVIWEGLGVPVRCLSPVNLGAFSGVSDPSRWAAHHRRVVDRLRAAVVKEQQEFRAERAQEEEKLRQGYFIYHAAGCLRRAVYAKLALAGAYELARVFDLPALAQKR